MAHDLSMRLAVRLHKAYLKRAKTQQRQLTGYIVNHYQSVFSDLGYHLDEAKSIFNKITRFRLQASSNFLYFQQEELRYQIKQIPNCLSEPSRLISCKPPPVPDLRLLYEEINQIKDEFSEVKINKSLTAITEDITIQDVNSEDVNFGVFEIELNLNSLEQGYNADGTITIKLREDLCSARALSGNIIHPHISGGGLCFGEGLLAANKALDQGRLFDLFTITNAVLREYSDGNPYHKITMWTGGGHTCTDCGSDVDEDCLHSCYRCSDDICDDCACTCEHCDETHCGSCMKTCSSCRTTYCRGCLSECDDCGRKVCSNCQYTCQDCNKTLCNNCNWSCNDCGNLLCDGCKEECPQCEEVFCSGCLEDGMCSSCLEEQNEQKEAEA